MDMTIPTKSSQYVVKKGDFEQDLQKEAENKVFIPVFGRFFGRDDKTRTCGIQFPKLARYQLRYIPTSFAS